MQFYDGHHEDRGRLVKECYLTMIAAVSEVQRGIEKLMSRGRSNGRKYYEKFAICVGQHYFKAFVSDTPYCFGDKKWWCLDTRDKPWCILLPCLKIITKKQ